MTLLDRWPQALLNNYGTPPVALVRGEGAVVTDEAGHEYVDLVSGVAVNALGHGHPAVVAAVTAQISTLGHVSNLYAAEPPIALAELLLALTGRPGRVFFANSGAEANEAAFKLSRGSGRTQVVAAVNGFHGRTMGALALTGQPAKADPFRPLPGEVVHVPYGDVEALAAAVSDATAMVILEPIQGEAGVVVPPPGYLTAAREITARHGALLALDEVQTGAGRTGSFFAMEQLGVVPDLTTFAKSIAGGFPLAGVCGRAEIMDVIAPGGLGGTYAGNPLACAAALAVMEVFEEEQLLERGRALGEQMTASLRQLRDRHPVIAEVRGLGAMVAMELCEGGDPHQPAAELTGRIVARAREKGLILLSCGSYGNVIRILVPLTVPDEQLQQGLDILAECFDELA